MDDKDLRSLIGNPFNGYCPRCSCTEKMKINKGDFWECVKCGFQLGAAEGFIFVICAEKGKGNFVEPPVHFPVVRVL